MQRTRPKAVSKLILQEIQRQICTQECSRALDPTEYVSNQCEQSCWSFKNLQTHLKRLNIVQPSPAPEN